MRLRALITGSANSGLRWLWYILVGICLVLGILFWASYFPGRMDHTYDGWAQFAILTICVFGYVLKWGWHYKGQSKFWAAYLVVLFAHCAVFLTLFSSGSWPIALLAVVGSVETMALATLIVLIVGERL
jgi:hypothetical protein